MPAILLETLYTRTSYTLADAVTEVLSDLALDDNTVITSGDVRRWMNRAQDIIARDTQAFEVTTVMGVTSGTYEYALPSESAGRAIAIIEVLYNDDPLPFLSLGQLYAYDPNWRIRGNGTPQFYYLRGMSAIGLYPAPALTESDSLTVTYRAIPPVVTEDEDQFYCPHGCEDALLLYAKLQASLKDAFGEGKERIGFYRGEWKEARARAVQVVAQTAEHEKVHMGEYSLYNNSPLPPSAFPPNSIATGL